MSFVRVDVFEGYVTGFAVVRGFFWFCIGFFFYVDDGGDWGGLLGFGFVDGVHEAAVPDHVAPVGGGVSAAAAAVYALAAHRWAG